MAQCSDFDILCWSRLEGDPPRELMGTFHSTFAPRWEKMMYCRLHTTHPQPDTHFCIRHWCQERQNTTVNFRDWTGGWVKRDGWKWFDLTMVPWKWWCKNTRNVSIRIGGGHLLQIRVLTCIWSHEERKKTRQRLCSMHADSYCLWKLSQQVAPSCSQRRHLNCDTAT
jgi:hypothetical protein